MLQNEYFVVEATDASFLLTWDQDSGAFGMGKPVTPKSSPLQLRIRDEVPAAPRFVDYHECEQPVVSARLAEALVPLNIYGVQWFAAQVRNPEAAQSPAHAMHYMHVWNRIHCLDQKASQLDLYEDGSIFGINQLVLNEAVLQEFPLEQRLVFELAEKNSVLLVHQAIKKAVEKIHAEGVQFYAVADWNSDVAFG